MDYSTLSKSSAAQLRHHCAVLELGFFGDLRKKADREFLINQIISAYSSQPPAKIDADIAPETNADIASEPELSNGQCFFYEAASTLKLTTHEFNKLAACAATLDLPNPCVRLAQSSDGTYAWSDVWKLVRLTQTVTTNLDLYKFMCRYGDELPFDVCDKDYVARLFNIPSSEVDWLASTSNIPHYVYPRLSMVYPNSPVHRFYDVEFARKLRAELDADMTTKPPLNTERCDLGTAACTLKLTTDEFIDLAFCAATHYSPTPHIRLTRDADGTYAQSDVRELVRLTRALTTDLDIYKFMCKYGDKLAFDVCDRNYVAGVLDISGSEVDWLTLQNCIHRQSYSLVPDAAVYTFYSVEFVKKLRDELDATAAVDLPPMLRIVSTLEARKSRPLTIPAAEMRGEVPAGSLTLAMFKPQAPPSESFVPF